MKMLRHSNSWTLALIFGVTASISAVAVLGLQQNDHSVEYVQSTQLRHTRSLKDLKKGLKKNDPKLTSSPTGSLAPSSLKLPPIPKVKEPKFGKLKGDDIAKGKMGMKTKNSKTKGDEPNEMETVSKRGKGGKGSKEESGGVPKKSAKTKSPKEPKANPKKKKESKSKSKNKSKLTEAPEFPTVSPVPTFSDSPTTIPAITNLPSQKMPTPETTAPSKKPSLAPAVGPTLAPATTGAPATAKPTLAPATGAPAMAGPTLAPATIPPATTGPPVATGSTAPTTAMPVASTTGAPSGASVTRVLPGFFIAYVVPSLGTDLTADDYNMLVTETTDFFSTFLNTTYPGFESFNLTFNNSTLNAGLPQPRFNVYVTWDASAIFASGGAPTATAVFQMMVNADFVDYILNYVRIIPAFGSTNEVLMRAL